MVEDYINYSKGLLVVTRLLIRDVYTDFGIPISWAFFSLCTFNKPSGEKDSFFSSLKITNKKFARH